MGGFSAALRDALQIDDVDTSEETVRQVVINQIRELDPQAIPRATGYFNHSWIPDLIIRWRNEADRSVFLRFDVLHPGFAEDLRYADDSKAPVFLDIAQPELERQRDEHRAQQALVDPQQDLAAIGAMVTEHQALGRLGISVNENRDVQQATKQIIRGGQGYVGVETAANVADYYQRAAAVLAPDRVQATDPDDLRLLLNVVEEPLSRIARLDLEAELRSRWVQGGREPESFPSLEDWQLSDRSPDEIATLVMALLASDDEVPLERWRDIAQTISLDALGAAARGRRRVFGGKVNDLLRAAQPYWTAKWAWVAPLERGVPTADSLDWSLGGMSFELVLDDQRAVFVDNGTRLNTLPRPEELPFLEPRLPTLNDPLVKGITLVTPEESVALHLRASATESLGERLWQLMAEQADVRVAGRIESLEVQLPGTECTALVNFSTGKVQASQAAPIAAFARLVAKFMVGLSDRRLDRLDEQFSG